MQHQSDKSHRLDEIKTQFRAREGYYRLMNSPDYSQRSQRAMGFSTGTTNSNSSTATHEKSLIRISLVTINEQIDPEPDKRQQQQIGSSATNSNSQPMKIHRRSKGARDMKICFNVGKELFVYNYDGVRTGPDASNPIYKRFYKGSSPTCHDFNQTTASAGFISLIVGFAHGQVQLIDLNGCDDQEACKEFNTDRLIDKTRVTCVKWLPNSSSFFLVAHASGQLYLYKDDLPCVPTAPTYQLYKQTGGVTVYTCKTKTTRNPIYKWSIGGPTTSDNSSLSSTFGSSSSLFKLDNESCSLNEFVFSPCAKYLACASQDGFLRVYCYDTMELVGRARSYYGGLTCVCWSPDGKYVVTGGEDDLITVWSFVERRVVARGIGHKSWVSVAAFDSFYTGYNPNSSDADNYDEDDEDEDKEVDSRDLEGDEEDDDEDGEMEGYNTRSRVINHGTGSKSPTQRGNDVCNNFNASNVNLASRSKSSNTTTYRFGSVGQDTQLCLWDLSDDLLQQPVAKFKSNTLSGSSSMNNLAPSISNHNSVVEDSGQPASPLDNAKADTSCEMTVNRDVSNSKAAITTSNATKGGLLSSKGAFTKTFSLVGKRDKRYFPKSYEKSANSKGHSNAFDGDRLVEDPIKLLGSPICPKMNEVPLIEPTICKKISFERLTSLVFCRGGFITSCQDGYVFSWARPSRVSFFIDDSNLIIYVRLMTT